MLKFLSRSSNETKKFARLLAEEIFSQPPRISSALVLALTGNLGSGKTTFIQGFCKRTGIKKRITSPTFVIIKKFQIPKSKFQINSKIQISKLKNLYHVDCYRVTSKELLSLGFRKVISNPQNLVLIEWAEKIKKILPPQKIIWIKFDYGEKEKERKIEINYSN